MAVALRRSESGTQALRRIVRQQIAKALEALERDVPNVDLARGVLREVVGTASGLNDIVAGVQDASPRQYAVTIKSAGSVSGCCAAVSRILPRCSARMPACAVS